MRTGSNPVEGTMKENNIRQFVNELNMSEDISIEPNTMSLLFAYEIYSKYVETNKVYVSKLHDGGIGLVVYTQENEPKIIEIYNDGQIIWNKKINEHHSKVFSSYSLEEVINTNII